MSRNEEHIRPLCGENGALRSFVAAALGYTEKVVILSPTIVEVKTDELCWEDTRVFSGSAEDMMPLIRVAAYMLSDIWPAFQPVRVALAAALGVNNASDAHNANEMRIKELVELYELQVENPNRSFRELYEATR